MTLNVLRWSLGGAVIVTPATCSAAVFISLGDLLSLGKKYGRDPHNCDVIHMLDEEVRILIMRRKML